MSRPRKLDHAAIIAAFEAGEPLAAISARFGCSLLYPSQLAIRYGLRCRYLTTIERAPARGAVLR